MSNQLSDGEKAVITVFVAVLAAATAGMVFFGYAMLGVTGDIGDLKAEVVQLKGEVTRFRVDVSSRFDDVEERLSRLETLIESYHGPTSRPAD